VQRIEFNGRNAFGAALLAFGALSLATLTNSGVAKAAIVAGAAALGLVAVLASRRLRAPSPEAVERVVHEWVVPAALLLVLVVFMAALSWHLYWAE
jgi:hypothetical protein